MEMIWIDKKFANKTVSNENSTTGSFNKKMTWCKICSRTVGNSKQVRKKKEMLCINGEHVFITGVQ